MFQKKRAFSLFELLLVIIIIVIMFGAITPMLGSFKRKEMLDASVSKLVIDLKLAQQFARVRRNGYEFYGIELYDNLGPDGDRSGYKLVFFSPLVDPANETIVKSSDLVDNPEFLENTFFEKNVVFASDSEFRANDPNPLILGLIVFNSNGSATVDGNTLLTSANDDIKLSDGVNEKIIHIEPLTGYVKVD